MNDLTVSLLLFHVFSHLLTYSPTLYIYYRLCLFHLVQVNDLMGRAYGTPEGLDDDDLEAELAALGDEFDNELVMDELEGAAQHAPSMSATATADEGTWRLGGLAV